MPLDHVFVDATAPVLSSASIVYSVIDAVPSGADHVTCTPAATLVTAVIAGGPGGVTSRALRAVSDAPASFVALTSK